MSGRPETGLKTQIFINRSLELRYTKDSFFPELLEFPAAGKKKTAEVGKAGGNYVSKDQEKLIEHDGAETQEELSPQEFWYKEFEKDKFSALYHLGFITGQSWMTPSVRYLYRLAELLIRRLSSSPELELMRGLTEASLTEEDATRLLNEMPFVIGREFVDGEWLRRIWERLSACFKAEMDSYNGTAAAYFAEYNSGIQVADRVYFHLVESHEAEYPFAFMATYSTKPVKSKKALHTPLKHALEEFEGDQKKLLSLLASVGRAAQQSRFISELMESGELFWPVSLTAEEAYTFLKEIPLYEEAGIMCRVPDWWRRKTNSLKLSLSVGNKRKSKVGLDALVDFEPSLEIDGEEVSEEQLRQFLEMAEGLVLYKGKWIEINKRRLSAALKALERARQMSEDGVLSLAEAMRLELDVTGQENDQEDDPEVVVSNGQWLRQVREMLTNPVSISPVEVEPTICVKLRGYQEEGYRWLNLMSELGFGACLADDMGLGKTVEIITWLEHYRVHRGGKALLVIPASLLGNWQKELEKFAPQMTWQILHKSAGNKIELGNKTEPGEENADSEPFLFITTYGMAARLEELKEMDWDVLILDEAQAIKNAGTRQTRAVKAIPSRLRVAMTGTPIENNLGDLWSLFDFLNQGLLGSAREFGALVKRLNEEPSGYMELRKIVSPFILRRLKTDRSIISDLPDKVEEKKYAVLTKRQTVLYKKLVAELTRELKDKEKDDIGRKGLVLAAIMKFKQICNHPSQYLGLDDYSQENSGKFELMGQICETIYEKRERVLVFTQFKEMTEPISAFLETVFHKKGLVLHGGTPVKKRNEMVETFNGEAYIPYMVLSLKAGGVGLNLTAASHVIHFDRWWNPAVENQATDRAFRIGQKNNVFVYKFITQGTIEEKIDAMIEEKQKLAGDILAETKEQWITELNNEELLKLFRLEGEKR